MTNFELLISMGVDISSVQKNLNKIKKEFQKFEKELNGTFEDVTDEAKDEFKDMEKDVSKTADNISKDMKKASDGTKKAFKGLSKEFSKETKDMVSDASKTSGAVEGKFKGLGGNAKASFSKIASSFTSATAGIRGDASKISSAIEGKFKGIGSSVKGSFEKIESGFKSATGNLKGLAGKVTDGIISKFKGVGGACKGAFSKIGGAFKTATSKIKGTASKIGASIKAEFSEGCEGAESSFRELAGSVKGIMSTIIGYMTLDAVGGIVDEAKQLASNSAKLKTAFETSGNSAKNAERTYSELYKVLGDGDRSVEASAHLAKLTNDQKALSEWTNICMGVYGTFGDSLPIEGLTEAVNHTAKLGEVQGVMADALEWSGINVEDFNEKLAKCSSESEREKLIRETLSKTYDEASESYKKNNAQVMALRESELKHQQAMEGLGTALTPVKVAMNDFTSNVMGKLSEVLGKIDLNGVIGKFSKFASFVGGLFATIDWKSIGEGLKGAWDKISGALSSIDWQSVLDYMREIGGYITDTFLAVIGDLADMLKVAIDKIKEFGESDVGQAVLGALKSFFKWIADNHEVVTAGLLGIAGAIGAFKVIGTIIKLFNGLSSVFAFITSPIGIVILAIGGLIAIGYLVYKNWDVIKEKAKELWEKLKEIFNKLKEYFAQVWSDIKENCMNLWNELTTFLKDTWTSIKNTCSNLWTSLKDKVISIVTTVKEWLVTTWRTIKEKVVGFVTNLKDSAVEKVTGLWTSLKNIVSNIKNFFVEGFRTLKDKVVSLATDIKDKAKSKFEEIVEYVKGLPKKLGDGIANAGKFFANGFIKMINLATSSFLKGVNYIIKGINFLYKKITDKNLIGEINVNKWAIPEFAKGVASYQGSSPVALVGERGSEIVEDPKHGTYLASSPQLVPLSKGASVYKHSETQRMLKGLGIRAYASGKKGQGILGKAWSKVKDWGSAIADAIGDVWEYVKNPSKLLAKVIDGIDLGFGSNKLIGGLASGLLNIFKGNPIVKWLKKVFSDNEDKNPNNVANIKGVEGWRTKIVQAGKYFGETLTENEIARILQQIKTESGGNQLAVQGKGVVDVNSRRGIFAKGLLQYIPTTFNAYKLKGFENIFNGYHQLLAFFNNSQWRKNLPQLGEKRGWSPRGKRRMKDGGIVKGGSWTNAILGDGYDDEAVIPLNAKSVKPLASSIASEMVNNNVVNGNQEVVIHTHVSLDGREIALASAKYTRDELNKMDARNNRRKGFK